MRNAVGAMVLQSVANVVIAPVQVVLKTFTSRVLRTLSLRGAGSGKFRPTKQYSLPVIEYGQLSSLYFAIDQAVQDDEVRASPTPAAAAVRVVRAGTRMHLRA